MAGLLLSGPAGAGKSQIARRRWEDHPGPAVIADFQSLYAAVSGDARGLDGRFPLRDERLLATVEYLRATLIRAAVRRDIYVIATNSDGSQARRAELLALIGGESEHRQEGAVEEVVDPGEDVVSARLADQATGVLSAECAQAIARWYHPAVRPDDLRLR